MQKANRKHKRQQRKDWQQMTASQQRRRMMRARIGEQRCLARAAPLAGRTYLTRWALTPPEAARSALRAAASGRGHESGRYSRAAALRLAGQLDEIERLHAAMQRERQRDALDAQINTLTQQMAWTNTSVLRQALANAAPGSASSIALQRAIGMRVDGEPQPAAQQPTPAQAAGLRTAAEGGGTLQAAAADYLNRSAPPAPATPQPVQRGLPQLPAAPAPQRTPEVFAGNAPAAGQGTASLPAVDNSAAGRAARDALPITSAQDAEGARAFSAAQQTPRSGHTACLHAVAADTRRRARSRVSDAGKRRAGACAGESGGAGCACREPVGWHEPRAARRGAGRCGH